MRERRISWVRDKIGPPRFLAFLVLLPLATAALHHWLDYQWERAFLIAFDACATLFVLSMLTLLRVTQEDEMKRYARENDANRGVFLLLTVVVVVALFITMAIELGKPKPDIYLVIGTLLAAWMFANTVFALHYAFMFWLEDGKGGLEFPNTDVPDFADFAYFAFNIGMSFSTADVNLRARAMRLTVLAHSLASYAYNIGVIAFALAILTN